ncbi:MAG: sulfur carrier protein ThiS [Candidatus Thermoplasmatota archaeon]|nr:sulfur carrier protein ThiS [Candidatus Thermoplasmatota archaeon]
MIEVNGRDVKYVESETVKQLLKRVKFTFPLVVVKINGKLIPRNKFSDVSVSDDSKISVIHMISGG